MQERDAALQQARTEVESLGKVLHELRISHLDTWDKCDPPAAPACTVIERRTQYYKALMPRVSTPCKVAPFHFIKRHLSQLVL